ncbi:putative flavoprotein involved in K+ transport [Arthrobacter sp. PvP023]|uniref:flavin-containing monooxygenase n=1 Tax=Micrococcaceae TaxID=1268 RepID=UPI001B61875A|nr:FAD-dependent oxidoreductase [Arthrobacter sp. PvP023]MBP1135153.1 putative flavoprotein involved in K+ transport [Arthrobacter sp. PvP023]
MDQDMQQFDVVVLGAGQAGLAAGYHLSRTGLRFVILEQAPRIGDVWRARWDSLRLFTPAQRVGLPGLAFLAARNTCPSKDEFADYLEAYARKFSLPVRTGVQVLSVGATGTGFAVTTTGGVLHARNVIAAVGANALPRIPAAAAGLDAGILQLHSSQYRRPADIPDGDVLVVGAGISGAEIALELAATHRTFISGRPTPHVPDPVLRWADPLYWRFIHFVLTTDNPLGRRVSANFHRHGAPLFRISVKDLDRAGVVRLPRFRGAAGGKPAFDDGTSRSVRTVIWATGHKPSLDWIEGLPVTDWGWPITRRGVVQELPGLYFVGMPFQYSLTSGLVGGVGRDAAYVVDGILERTKAGDPTPAK